MPEIHVNALDDAFSIGIIDISILISVVCVAFLVFWAIVDASFPDAVQLAQIDVGWSRHPGLSLTSVHSFRQLGPRVFLLIVGVVTGWLALFVGVLMPLMLRPGSIRIHHILIVIALCACWLCFHTSWTTIAMWGRMVRLFLARKEIAILAEQLDQDWPTVSGEIAGLGLCVVNAASPGCLAVKPNHPNYPIRERIGPLVHRVSDGVIVFDLRSSIDRQVTYARNGTPPQSFHANFKDPKVCYILRHYDRIGESMYLTRYEMVESDSQ